MNTRHEEFRPTILEPGRERKHPGLLRELLSTARGRLLVLGIGGVAAISGYALADDKPEGILSCNTTTQELGYAPNKSEALAIQLPGINDQDWDQIAAVPVTTPTGEVRPFGEFGPQGPPAGSEIPTNCTPN